MAMKQSTAPMMPKQLLHTKKLTAEMISQVCAFFLSSACCGPPGPKPPPAGKGAA
jgi:hypothetical protein